MANDLIGVNLVDKIVPFTDADQYPTHEDVYGKGGYVSLSGFPTAFNTLTAGTGIPYGENGSGRQKIGQIIYDQQTNNSYQIKTPGPLSGFFDLVKTLPYEYGGSNISNSIVAKNANNIITTFRGLDVNGELIENEINQNSAILAGSDNLFLSFQTEARINAYNSLIVGGSANTMWRSSWCTIGGGSNNLINQGTSHTTIAGGKGNFINSLSDYSFIGGGFKNLLGAGYISSKYCAIVGGDRNSSIGTYDFIGGGSQNISVGRYNVIGGGDRNQAGGFGDVVVGGRLNKTFGISEGGSVLSVQKYDNVDSLFATKTVFAKYENAFVETVPGARVSGIDTAGIINIYPYTNSINDALTGYTPSQTITSDSPTVSGAFGFSIFSIFPRGNTGNDRYHTLIVGEPGANKVHLISFNCNNTSQPVSSVQVLDLSIIDPSASPLSQFGYSIHYIYNGYNSPSFPNTPYGIISVGAPGSDSVYLFKTNRIDPTAPIGENPNFEFLQKLEGQSGSRFGHSLASSGYLRTDTEYISAMVIGVGAPLQVTPTGRSGAVNIYVAELGPGYSYTNKTFTTFTRVFSSFSISASPNNNIAGGLLYNYALEGDEMGESFAQNIVFQSRRDDDGLAFRLDIKDRILANDFNPYALSSYYVFYYVNAPKKDLVYRIKPDPSDPAKLLEQTFFYDINYTLTPALTSEYVAITAYNAGSYWGKITFLTGGDNGDYKDNGYGVFSILGQINFKDQIYYGPGRSTGGVYSMYSLLTGTNLKSINPGASYRSQTVTDPYFNHIQLSDDPTNYSGDTQKNYPGSTGAFSQLERSLILPPYPDSNYNNIKNYGFMSYKWPGTDISPGLARFYFLSGGDLCVSNAKMDFPGEGNTNSTILGGDSNTIRSKNCLILGGTNNTIDSRYVRSFIFSGVGNIIRNNTDLGTSLRNALIGGGDDNIIDGTENCIILNGTSNFIGKLANYSAILGGRNNIVNQNVENSFVLGSNLIAVSSNTTYVENLIATEHLKAKTKSFYIDHPSKPGKKLKYGSLESPYHGVRLTGEGVIRNNKCEVYLPDYISSLVYFRDINIQLTPVGLPVLLYIGDIDIYENKFEVRSSGFMNYFKPIKFFWSFTGIRKDVDKLIVEE